MSIQVDRRMKKVVIDGLKFDISLIGDKDYMSWKTRCDDLMVTREALRNMWRDNFHVAHGFYEHFKQVDPAIVTTGNKDGMTIFGYTVNDGLRDETIVSGCVEKTYTRRDKWTYRVYMRKCDALVESIISFSEHEKKVQKFLRESPSEYRIVRKIEEIVQKYCSDDTLL